MATTPIELLIEAVKYRYSNRGRNLSFFDAVGYVYALRNGLRLLTADNDLEGLPNVELAIK